jgi:hypothetical protein
LDVAAHHQNDSAYFAAIDRQMEAGGAAAMLYDLLHMDLTDFDVRKMPSTDALVDQKLHSLEGDTKWLLDVLMTGEIPGAVADIDWGTTAIDVVKEELHRSYVQSANHGRTYRIKTKSEFGKRLKQIIPNLTSRRPRAGDAKEPFRLNVYSFPPLPECRTGFEQFIRSKIKWE